MVVLAQEVGGIGFRIQLNADNLATIVLAQYVREVGFLMSHQTLTLSLWLSWFRPYVKSTPHIALDVDNLAMIVLVQRVSDSGFLYPS